MRHLAVSFFIRTSLWMVFLWTILCHTPLCAQDLGRQPWFGAKISTTDKGLLVEYVAGGTSQALALEKGDVITAIEEQKVKDKETFIQLFQQKKYQESIQLTIERAGKVQQQKGKVAGRPQETMEGGTVIYDQAPYKGGQLRVIINKPNKQEKMPALLFIPGYTCSSIDGLPSYHPYKRIIDAYTAAGYVTLRIEKSGLGDSQNTPACSSCNLVDEVENFEAGLLKLKSLPYVDTSKIIIFGHSMGGIVAPAISAQHSVAGVVVYGTSAKSWFEYQLEMYRVQFPLSGMNPLEVEEGVRAQYDLNYRYFVQKESLEEMAKDPVTDSLLRTTWEYKDGKIFGRNAEYWRQIQDFPLLGNWKNTTAAVLVQYGEADFQAFSRADHEQIVNTVNHYHPEQATLKVLPQTDHYFALSGTRQEAYDLFINGKYQTLFDSYNPEVGASAVAWSNALLNLPKVTK